MSQEKSQPRAELDALEGRISRTLEHIKDDCQQSLRRMLGDEICDIARELCINDHGYGHPDDLVMGGPGEHPCFSVKQTIYVTSRITVAWSLYVPQAQAALALIKARTHA